MRDHKRLPVKAASQRAQIQKLVSLGFWSWLPWPLCELFCPVIRFPIGLCRPCPLWSVQSNTTQSGPDTDDGDEG